MRPVEKASCTFPYTAVRKKPNEGSEQVTQALFGDPVDVRSRADGWAEVAIGDGFTGWVSADALGEPPAKDRAHVVVVPQAADRYLGAVAGLEALRTARYLRRGRQRDDSRARSRSEHPHPVAARGRASGAITIKGHIHDFDAGNGAVVGDGSAAASA
jgi:hypothetical protein